MGAKRKRQPKRLGLIDLGIESVQRLDALPTLLVLFTCGCSYWLELARAGHLAWVKRLHCYPHLPR